MMKKCPRCKRDLPESEFYTGSSKLCKGCMTWQNLTYNSKKEGRQLDFTKETFLAFYGLSGTRHCHYCGISETDFTDLKRKNPRGYYVQCLGLDRADSGEGYSPDNAKFSCLICNRIKSDIFSIAEMKKLGKLIGLIWAERKQKRNID